MKKINGYLLVLAGIFLWVFIMLQIIGIVKGFLTTIALMSVGSIIPICLISSGVYIIQEVNAKTAREAKRLAKMTALSKKAGP